MEYKDAVGIIESCAGFSDIETPVGEAWDIVLRRVARLEDALQKIADGRGMIPDNSTIYMSGKVPEVPKHFNMYDMREIARRALEEK